MKTENLTKTNISKFIQENYKEIEHFLGKEIDSVYNYKIGFDKTGLIIYPGSIIYRNNYPCNRFKPFTMINKDYFFDRDTEILTIKGRDAYKRNFYTKKFKLEKVGYKLRTTGIEEGYIFGLPKEIID